MPAPITIQEPAELLKQMFASWSTVKKKKVREWLKFKKVTVNGQIISQFDHPLKPGDVVAIRTDDFAPPDTRLSSGIRIRHEDEAILVIEKPEKLLTIASEKVRDNTAYFYLNEYLRKGNRYAEERVWIVHRLDRDTSGLMIFAKTEKAKRTLQEGWDAVVKRYFAVVEGVPPQPEGTIESHLNEEDPGKVYITRDEEQGRLAITHYRLVKKNALHSLLEVTLETGRRHQIRVQLAHAGCPIVGDDKYGTKKNPIRRLALHACYLQFPHPETGALMTFQSTLPGSFGPLLVSPAEEKKAASPKSPKA